MVCSKNGFDTTSPVVSDDKNVSEIRVIFRDKLLKKIIMAMALNCMIKYASSHFFQYPKKA